MLFCWMCCYDRWSQRNLVKMGVMVWCREAFQWPLQEQNQNQDQDHPVPLYLLNSSNMSMLSSTHGCSSVSRSPAVLVRGVCCSGGGQCEMKQEGVREFLPPGPSPTGCCLPVHAALVWKYDPGPGVQTSSYGVASSDQPPPEERQKQGREWTSQSCFEALIRFMRRWNLSNNIPNSWDCVPLPLWLSVHPQSRQAGQSRWDLTSAQVYSTNDGNIINLSHLDLGCV